MTLVKSESKCENDIFCGINVPENTQDVESMTDLEKKHLPVITAPESVKKGETFEVTVEVGKYKEHPNEPKHHFEFMELYAGHTYLGRIDFMAQITEPVMKMHVTLDHIHGDLRAFAYCNLHGVWMGKAPIEITE
ncbi:Putative superoxide reductase [Anaerohalosphaera lusitana]|uniref:Putative superoxide reductase n=1 Tax=Anaerohalosphaera lusitana TaxID=1936003 RepID=A0A1U9NKC9_9BACT|nr:class II SORL domain-containing protein [Anaerohalosphaera lusitana]AQT67976.1 Putative superoxide reductase [Anaerohalosphaera lusitana]